MEKNTREIKFRAWDKKRGKWVIDHEFYIRGNGSIWRFEALGGDRLCNHFLDKEREEPLVVMQFTGLKDKNGKEIYEGDIVACERDYWDNPKSCVVEWREYDAGFNLFYPKDPVDSEVLADRKNTGELSTFQVSEHERTVIGNIYEMGQDLKNDQIMETAREVQSEIETNDPDEN